MDKKSEYCRTGCLWRVLTVVGNRDKCILDKEPTQADNGYIYCDDYKT